ncbi:MAG: dihydropteroate synthase-like protein [Candidatus Bathyarchaeota archaeon]|nr:dihydropteroate synthase-like protein [Candidatus Bathyarchaeota archaeon]
MTILLITGTLAEATVKQYAQQSQTPTEVLALNVQVAAFLTPTLIAKSLQKTSLQGITAILTPGQILGDTQTITDATHIPAYKGPRYAADLPTIMDCIGQIELSTTQPADDLLRERLQQNALQELERVEANRSALLANPRNLLVGDVAVGRDFPMRVLAEIVDAPLLETAEIARLAKRFVAGGANIIDVGMVAGQCLPAEAKRAVAAVKAAVDVPVSIDSLNPVEIKAAVEAGVDLILSADAGNLKAIAPYAQDTAVVVIPTNQRRGIFPTTPAARVHMLERLIKQAKQLGFKRIIGDLILAPTNILDSYVAFQQFSGRNPDVPLLIGIANVVELFDADSVGLNALLARLASEVNVGVLLVTEATPKARGSVAEAAAASKMMFLAKQRSSVPRDLGVDLLILKEKTNPDTAPPVDISKVPLTQNPTPATVTVDPCGVFRIMVDRDGGSVVALHYASVDAPEPLHVVRGADGAVVLAELLRRGWVSRLEHAGYLGLELAKAEVALRVGRGYVQDAALFK